MKVHLVMGLSLLPWVVGCSGGVETYPTAQVTGKVTFEGKPVESGSIAFIPQGNGGNYSGKSGVATVGTGGSYSVSTYVNGDGAVVGKHKIGFSPAPMEAPKPQEGAHVESPVSPYAGLVPKQPDVTVARGTNKIDIELVKSEPEPAK